MVPPTRYRIDLSGGGRAVKPWRRGARGGRIGRPPLRRGFGGGVGRGRAPYKRRASPKAEVEAGSAAEDKEEEVPTKVAKFSFEIGTLGGQTLQAAKTVGESDSRPEATPSPRFEVLPVAASSGTPNSVVVVTPSAVKPGTPVAIAARRMRPAATVAGATVGAATAASATWWRLRPGMAAPCFPRYFCDFARAAKQHDARVAWRGAAPVPTALPAASVATALPAASVATSAPTPAASAVSERPAPPTPPPSGGARKAQTVALTALKFVLCLMLHCSRSC